MMTIDLLNCSELIDTLIEYYNYYNPSDYSNYKITFQGDRVYLEGIGVSSASTIIIKNNYIFFVSAPYKNYDYHKGAKTINLHICKSGENIDQIPTAVIPAYIRQELIETLKGEW